MVGAHAKKGIPGTGIPLRLPLPLTLNTTMSMVTSHSNTHAHQSIRFDSLFSHFQLFARSFSFVLICKRISFPVLFHFDFLLLLLPLFFFLVELSVDVYLSHSDTMINLLGSLLFFNFS